MAIVASGAHTCTIYATPGYEAMIYIVTAHRWGWLNTAWYYVWAGTDRSKAEELAAAEVISRGDKYGCQVVRCIESAEDMQFERVAYFPSAYSEKAPYYSPYIEMHQELGQLVRDAVLSGTIFVPDPENPRFTTSVRVESPQWLVDEVTRRMALAQAQDSAEQNGRKSGA